MPCAHAGMKWALPTLAVAGVSVRPLRLGFLYATSVLVTKDSHARRGWQGARALIGQPGAAQPLRWYSLSGKSVSDVRPDVATAVPASATVTQVCTMAFARLSGFAR